MILPQVDLLLSIKCVTPPIPSFLVLSYLHQEQQVIDLSSQRCRLIPPWPWWHPGHRGHSSSTPVTPVEYRMTHVGQSTVSSAEWMFVRRTAICRPEACGVAGHWVHCRLVLVCFCLLQEDHCEMESERYACNQGVGLSLGILRRVVGFALDLVEFLEESEGEDKSRWCL